MGALKDKTVLLVTHQVDFLHNVDSIMVCISSQQVPKMFEFSQVILPIYS
jgi:ABC-type transport system involved in cytochrome bd biosynthesis fused ATPase/permease subunit